MNGWMDRWIDGQLDGVEGLDMLNFLLYFQVSVFAKLTILQSVELL